MRNLLIIIVGMFMFTSCSYYTANIDPNMDTEVLTSLRTGTHDTLKVIILDVRKSDTGDLHSLYVDVTNENFKPLIKVKEKEGSILTLLILFVFLLGILIGVNNNR